jgi:hypothetical protein
MRNVAHKEAAVSILEKLDKDNKFLREAIFFDEAAFHFSRKVNKWNNHIGRSEHPYATVGHIKDNSKVNVWCGLLCYMVYLNHARVTVTSPSYLDVLKNFCPFVVTRTAACCSFPARRHTTTPELVCTFLNQHVAIIPASLDQRFPKLWIFVMLVPSFSHQISHP